MLFCVIQGLIFVVDSNDRERAMEAREELSKMVRFVVYIYIYFFFLITKSLCKIIMVVLAT